MKKIVVSLITIFVVSLMTVNATSAYFSDNETSSGNAFTAGTLDLNLDGVNTNVVKFNISEMVPGESFTDTWDVYNDGTIPGFLDLENIVKSSGEYGCTEPEDILDDTCGNPGTGEGDLLSLLNIQLFVDVDNNQVFDGADSLIYNGLASGLTTNYEQNLPLASTETKHISMVVSWPSTTNDNLGQGDKFNLDLSFELAQTTGQ